MTLIDFILKANYLVMPAVVKAKKENSVMVLWVLKSYQMDIDI